MPATIGTPGTANATRLVLLGSGELGREVALEAKRLGCEVVAVDRYEAAPAMQVSDRSAVVDMTDPGALGAFLEEESARPCAEMVVVPEIEAIATGELERLEEAGMRVVPTARAARLTMDRERIRRLAAEELGLLTSPYRFCGTRKEVEAAIDELGVPCVVKPVMSSSGKGQSVVSEPGGSATAWEHAASAGRTGEGRVIVEGFVQFEYEITLLTVRHAGGTSFCSPIGHVQQDGDYRESWQPQPMSAAAEQEAERVARAVTGALGGSGIFGVELFVSGDEVIFSEVSPRPHDTGMVTMVTQDLSEFALHVRAILDLPVPEGRVPLVSPGASAVILASADGDAPVYTGVPEALSVSDDLQLRIFGKPDARPGRRMGVALAAAPDADEARRLAASAADAVEVISG